jgi:GNAT superfamily N-acetyltransferase
MLTIARATSPDDIAAVKLLLRGLVQHFRDHGEDDLADDEFDHEVGTPDAEFAEPHGRMLLARLDGQPVGILALRPTHRGTGVELRRMYVLPAARRHGVGRALIVAMIEEARAMGEPVLRLVTVPAFSSALALYESLGFRRVPQFRPSSAPDALFMERELTE